MTTEHTLTFYRSVKEKLDSVGPGMCLAKWHQVTLHLENGHNHSCHHPATHQTQLEELEEPGSLHNSRHKKYQRRDMLEKRRPAECRYCWNIEDTVSNEDVFSDRVLKSSGYMSPAFEDTVGAGWDANPYPTDMEVSFSTTCNFKCSYCSADVSSSWMKELKEHGPYPTEFPLITLQQISRTGKMPISDRDPNPYIDAFWKWWPDLYPNLKKIRITGGEPLLSPHTFKVFDWIIDNPRPDLELAVNSNMCVPPVLIQRFTEKIKIMLEAKAIKSFVLYTSCEAHGAHAEYIRNGMNYNEWLDNCKLFLTQVPNAIVSLMSTYNAMSVTSYVNFLIDMVQLKKTFNNRVIVDTVYMANPKMMSIDILPADYLIYIQQQLNYVKTLHGARLFGDWELHKIERILEYFESRLADPMDKLDMFRRDFKVFVDEHDHRRGTNFLETFPKMKDFYTLCEKS